MSAITITSQWDVFVQDRVTLPKRKPEIFERVYSVMAKSEVQARRIVVASGISANRIIRVEKG